ncbi:hypothetical protein F4777DRAFT_599448 [Nemania sp. FL0916]|nr:hypothetical protein F4777DRAFT_599448 [Nemania sp. FL0916]
MLTEMTPRWQNQQANMMMTYFDSGGQQTGHHHQEILISNTRSDLTDFCKEAFCAILLSNRDLRRWTPERAILQETDTFSRRRRTWSGTLEEGEESKMYSPYGSYSSMGSSAQPLDITPSSYLSRDAAHHASCAFPSWPQRSSLMESAREERATSYLSDDDLFLMEPISSDDNHSIASGSSTASASPFVSEEELLEIQRQKMAMQREAIKHLLNEKERRRQQYKRTRKGSSGSKKSSSSPKAKQDQMAPITEAGE